MLSFFSLPPKPLTALSRVAMPYCCSHWRQVALGWPRRRAAVSMELCQIPHIALLLTLEFRTECRNQFDG